MDETAREALAKEPPGMPPAPRPFGILATVALVGLMALGARMVLSAFPAALPEATLPLLFLICVLVPAVGFGFWTGLLAAVLAFGALNYLFTDPLYTFHISSPQDLFVLLVFLLVAALAGLLAGRLHDQAEAARARSEALTILSALSSDLAAAETTEGALRAAVHHLGRLCGGVALAVAGGQARPEVQISLPEGRRLDPAELAAAERCLRQGLPEPAAAQGWPGSAISFLPVTEGLALGHARLTGREGPRRSLAIAALIVQTRLALQRLDFAEKARAERLRAEAEATRSAVLTSLSHDLRTPLATILGSASALQELDARLAPEARGELLSGIVQEAERLARHVGNLVQLSRLELAAPPRRDWVDVNDIATAAVARARRSFAAAQVTLGLSDLPMIRAESGLLEQALFNLIDNALSHGRGPVRVESGRRGGLVFLAVRDAGPGLPPPLADWLSGPEMRPAAGQRGLGLAVAKGIARHLGGTLLWQDGALVLTLPEDA